MRSSLTQFAKEEALRLGFILAGVTSPDPPPHWSTYNNWLVKGRNAGMSYLATERSLQRRADPLHILPECQSILVLGFLYPQPLPLNEGREQDPVGRIAAYACGQDYHLVLPGLMLTLVNSLQRRLGFAFPYRCHTDSGPILERDLAQRAGLGWIGRNTCLINPRHGSYILLAEIMLGIDLDLDPPFEKNHCGSCMLCIQACPTGCILPDRTLDSNRCISFLSIENKTLIPVELRSAMGNWVFGCDICQVVCPWNRFAVKGNVNLLKKEHLNGHPNLLEELSLTSKEFNQKYGDTALMRARRSRYLRNVIVAFANSGYPGDISLLKKLVNDPDPLVREHAAWAVASWK